MLTLAVSYFFNYLLSVGRPQNPYRLTCNTSLGPAVLFPVLCCHKLLSAVTYNYIKIHHGPTHAKRG